MINIISTQAHATQVRGPYKVFANLVKGLDRIGYPYVINRDLNATKRLWIHDDVTALSYMQHSKAYKVVGPNLFVLPSDMPPNISFANTIYLQPCEWAKQMWAYAGFSACPLQSWPVGIDTDEFSPAPNSVNSAEKQVLVYYKRRDPQELPRIFSALHSLGLSYRLVLYQSYSETEYKQLLSDTSFVIWHGGAESQGIALQEAMAMNVPILLCDVASVSQTHGGYPFASQFHDLPVTAAPYFDENCGIRITDLDVLPTALHQMLQQCDMFQPRDYVLGHLSLEGQARAFIALWERWELSPEQGRTETATNRRAWMGAPLLPRLAQRGFRKIKPALIDTWRRFR